MERDATEEENIDSGGPVRRARWRQKRWAIPSALLALLIALGIGAWFSRVSIVDDLIRDQLETYGIPATYRIEKVSGGTQVLSDVVVGDPQRPDFTARRIEVKLRHRFGFPDIGALTVIEPRLYGTYLDGKLSFGTLDGLIFAPSDKAPALPNLNIAVRDGRGLIETDFGPIGLKMAGSGLVSHAWSGMLAATAPRLEYSGCVAQGATLYGKLTTSTGEPHFDGPLRFDNVVCTPGGVALRDYDIQLKAMLSDALADPSFEGRIEGGASQAGDYALASLAGTVRAQLRKDLLTGRYSLAARAVDTPQALAAVLTAEGQMRATDGLENLQADSAIEANGLRLGTSAVAAIQDLSRTGEGTLIAPLVARLAGALQTETRGSSLTADLRLRRTANAYSILAPRLELTGGSGARIVSLSRFELARRDGEAPRLSGNVATGGAGLPQISGRMERSVSGNSVFRMAMERYAAGGSALAIPEMVVAQSKSGDLGFAGRLVASGPLPGGTAANLQLPVDGRFAGGEWSVWRSCTNIRFDSLQLANLRFEKRGLTLCPARGRPILTYGNRGLRIAAGAPSLDLAGYLGETPIHLASGPVGFAWPGAMTARAIDVALGPPATASRFRISDLDARIGDTIAGSFSGADIALAAVPMDLREAKGVWDYTNGKVTVADASFTLFDRENPARFEPLSARSATLTLVDNLIDARAELRHPATDRLITVADIRHNLASGAGHADLAVPGIEFDSQLQPDQLSRLALGVIANASGVVNGTGRIDWSASGEVTSTGAFSSEALDFAAAFGPVRGASGTIVFTDLLGLTTAPGQKIRVAAVNPGIEVLDGEVEFELLNGEVLALKGGNWPFMGGRLILRDVDLNLGVSEARRYTFEIVGLDAAQFLAQMDLKNLSATGLFDGTIPIIFDSEGVGRIEEGVLVSRPPGGNISYVGELTYEDLSPIANFAFDALKSLDYTQMRVVMEGPLTGEIVTRVRFDGVSQGTGAKSNFITRRLASLPLQFRINIRAQFYQLITSMKSLYDPAAVRDPRDLGLLSDDGTRLLRRSVTGEDAEPEIRPEDIIPDEPAIQDQESE